VSYDDALVASHSLGFPPFFLMATRFTFSGRLLLAWQLARGATRTSLWDWLNSLLIGTLMLGCGMGGTAFAEQTIVSGLVDTFVTAIPVLLVVINLAFGGYPCRGELVAVLVGLAGVLMLTKGAGVHGSPASLVSDNAGLFRLGA
jgi:drug/metabolite transporter (DMT)-like permease